MNKIYQIRTPRGNPFFLVLLSMLFIFYIATNIRFDNSNNLYEWFFTILFFIFIVIQVIVIIRFGDEIVITHNSLKTKHGELPINEIEKVIIEGYFVQSIGIKRIGKRFVPASLHFRFKNNEEEQVKEWEQWAKSNGIKVVKGTIYSWI